MATLLPTVFTDDEPQESPLKSFVGRLRTGVRRLPQGACTSPHLANLIASRLDRRIKSVLLAMRLEVGEWSYTRYADDLVFSTEEGDAHVGKVLQVVKRLIHAEGFQPNEKKTAIMRAPSRQLVTGIVVGEELRLPREYLRKVRALLHTCETLGFEGAGKALGVDALHVARGHYAYVAMVMPERARDMVRRYPWLRG